MHYTYLLKLSNNDHYAGSTKDLKERLEKHQSGGVPHTLKFRPVKLAKYCQETFDHVCGAIENKHD